MGDWGVATLAQFAGYARFFITTGSGGWIQPL